MPYFYKILKSEVFVILDDVQYQKNGFQNRNLIKTPTGSSYLTIPVICTSNSLIKDVKIGNKIYISKILKTLKNNYSKAKYFRAVFDEINNLIEKNNYIKLSQLNNDLILLFLKLMNANVKIKYSSDFNLSSKKDDLILDLILALKQNNYITGSGGLNYINFEKFNKNKIELYEYNFNYINYQQLWKKLGFIKNLSIVDLLFNELEQAKDYILTNGSLNIIKI